MVAGLFCGRVLADFTYLRPLAWITLTLIVTTLAAWLLRRVSLVMTWPLLLLLVYVLYPEISPQWVGIAAALTVFVLVINGVLIERGEATGKQDSGASPTFTPVAPPLRTTYHAPRIIHHFIPLILFLTTLTLFISTLSPDILPADNGEFQYTGTLLGVAHPPGFPLYTLLSWLITKLPLAMTPAYKINLLSAFTSAATVVVVYLAVSRTLRGVPRLLAVGKGAPRIAGFAAALTLATSTTFWAQATTANIRSLTALFSALAFYVLLRHQEEKRSIINGPLPMVNDKWLWWWALTVGLGLTHHLSLAFISGVMGLYLLWVDFDLLKQPKRWLRPLLFFLLGFLPWFYLLWRGAAGAIGAPDDLTTWRGFFNHALGLGFRGDVFYLDSWQALWQRLQVMGNVLTFQFHPFSLVGMTVGFLLLLWRNRQLAFLLGGSFFLHTFITATYRAPQTVEYMLPAYVPLVMMLGYGVFQVSSFEFRVHAPRTTHHALSFMPYASRILLGLIFLAAALQFVSLLPSYQWLAHVTDTRDTVQPWLDNAPPDAVLLAEWHWFTPLRYLQAVEGVRPDVQVVYVVPTAEPYNETWARLIGEELDRGRTVITTHYEETAYSQLPASEPYHQAFLFRQNPLTELPGGYITTTLLLGETVQIAGYHLQPTEVAIGQETNLTVAWSRLGELPPGTTLFVHLVAEDGSLLAQADVALRPQTNGLTLTPFPLIPRPGAVPGSYTIMLGAYQYSLEGLQTLPDATGQARTPLTTLHVTAMTQPPFTRNPVYRTVPSGRPLLRLVGYDWDFTLPEPRLYLHWQTEQGYQTEVRDGAAALTPILPEFRTAWGRWQPMTLLPPDERTHYVPFGDGLIWLGDGLPVDIAFAPRQSIMLPQWFTASQPILRDYHLSVTLIGFQRDSQLWAWRNGDERDSVPALGAIPTLKWVAGSRVWSPHEVVVDAAAFSDQRIIATVRLYDAFTHQTIPILDERMSQQGPWLMLGEGRVEN